MSTSTARNTIAAIQLMTRMRLRMRGPGWSKSSALSLDAAMGHLRTASLLDRYVVSTPIGMIRIT